MAQCETCGNEYDKAFQVVIADVSHTFDSFECAIHTLAPACEHCGCKIIGHGIEADEVMYCCVHCASQHGVKAVQDRTWAYAMLQALQQAHSLSMVRLIKKHVLRDEQEGRRDILKAVVTNRIREVIEERHR